MFTTNKVTKGNQTTPTVFELQKKCKHFSILSDINLTNSLPSWTPQIKFCTTVTTSFNVPNLTTLHYRTKKLKKRK